MKLLAHRPAYIQVTWLGFPGTTGQGDVPLYVKLSNQSRVYSNHPLIKSRIKSEVLGKPSAIDHLLADKYVVPPETLAMFYSEKLIYFPGTYQPQDELQGSLLEIKEKNHNNILRNTKTMFPSPRMKSSFVEERMDFLSSNNINFNKIHNIASINKIVSSPWLICFNRLNKITREVYSDWMMILLRSRNRPFLLMMSEAMESESNLKVRILFFYFLYIFYVILIFIIKKLFFFRKKLPIGACHPPGLYLFLAFPDLLI